MNSGITWHLLSLNYASPPARKMADYRGQGTEI